MNRGLEVSLRMGQRYRRLYSDAVMQLIPSFCGPRSAARRARVHLDAGRLRKRLGPECCGCPNSGPTPRAPIHTPLPCRPATAEWYLMDPECGHPADRVAGRLTEWVPARSALSATRRDSLLACALLRAQKLQRLQYLLLVH